MKISFIGAGKMAEAMIAAFLRARTVHPHAVFASDVDAHRREYLKKTYGINTYSNNHIVTGSGEIIILAVKPQNMEEVLREIAPDVTRKHLVISIAAGKKLETIEGALKAAKVIRVMPNLACITAAGMNVFCSGSRVTPTDRKTVNALLACVGRVLELPEAQFDIVTALSGSGPAFFAYVAELMIEAGIKQGLNRTDATLLVSQTMHGTAQLLLEQKMEPLSIISAVKSPKGTTAAGLAVLEKPATAKTIHETIHAAAERSRELSS